MGRKHIGGLILFIGFAAVAAAGEPDADWRKTATPQEKLEKLIEAMPGAGTLMMEMGSRYQNLYWAARQGKWEFAAYQAEEMKELLEVLMIARPKRAVSAREFSERVFPVLEPAIRARNWQRFAAAFERMRQECVACHAKNEHGFITLPVPKRAPSPVLNME